MGLSVSPYHEFCPITKLTNLVNNFPSQVMGFKIYIGNLKNHGYNDTKVPLIQMMIYFRRVCMNL